MRTSHTHPLKIALVRQRLTSGRIVIAFHPGKRQPYAATGAGQRNSVSLRLHPSLRFRQREDTLSFLIKSCSEIAVR